MLPEEYQPPEAAQNRFCYFEDRHRGARDRTDAAARAGAVQREFYGCMYDSEAKTLYYCEADS